MKATGITRRVDTLGRIMIPKSIRQTLDIAIKDPIEIFIDGEYIILKKYRPSMACQLTDEVSDDNLVFGEIVLSRSAAKEVRERIAEYLK